MSAIAARFSGSPMADRWFRGDFRTVRVKSEHVPGESIFVTALTMLKAAKNRHRARRSRRLSSRSANCRTLRHTKPAAMETAVGKKRPLVIAAIAREMAAFLWAIAQHVAPAA
jgi:arylamine N-acetyltransferase